MVVTRHASKLDTLYYTYFLMPCERAYSYCHIKCKRRVQDFDNCRLMRSLTYIHAQVNVLQLLTLLPQQGIKSRTQ